MTDRRRKANDEKPQEEFVNDGIGKTEGDEDSNANKMKLEEWPLQELQQKARDEGIEGHEKMDREELIEKLQQQR